MPSMGGQSAVAVPVPEVEGLVASWRKRFDGSAAGMPAHITVLYPFLPVDRLTAEVVAELAELCASHPAQQISFSRMDRFPGVLYLDPEPASELRRLTRVIAERWPEAQPYGGAHSQIVPHLTVAQGPEGTLDTVAAAITAYLPATATLTRAGLYAFDGAIWQERMRLPFKVPAAANEDRSSGAT